MMDDNNTVIKARARFRFSGVGSVELVSGVCVGYYLFSPFCFFWCEFGRGWDRMGRKKLWERAWDDGLTGGFAYWERPLL